jgi:hypothetical protein
MMPRTSAPERLARSRISTAVPYLASSSKLTKMTFLSRNLSWFSSVLGSLALVDGGAVERDRAVLRQPEHQVLVDLLRLLPRLALRRDLHRDLRHVLRQHHHEDDEQDEADVDEGVTLMSAAAPPLEPPVDMPMLDVPLRLTYGSFARRYRKNRSGARPLASLAHRPGGVPRDPDRTIGGRGRRRPGRRAGSVGHARPGVGLHGTNTRSGVVGQLDDQGDVLHLHVAGRDPLHHRLDLAPVGPLSPLRNSSGPLASLATALPAATLRSSSRRARNRSFSV